MSNIVEADYTIEYERTLPVIISEIKILMCTFLALSLFEEMESIS